MTNYYSVCNYNDVIQHFGVKGMKWGHKKTRESIAKSYLDKGYTRQAAYNKADKKLKFNKNIKKGAKIAGGLAVAGLAAYGAYKGYGALKANKIAYDARKAAERMADEKRIFKEIKETSKKYKDNVKKHFPDGISGGAGKKFQERFKQRSIEIKNLASDLDSQNSRLKKVVKEIKKNNRNSNFDGYRKQLAENRKLLDSML